MRPAVDIDHDRPPPAVGQRRGPDIQEQAVFALVRLIALLRRGMAIGRGVSHSSPCRRLLRRSKATGAGVGAIAHTLEDLDVPIDIAAHPAVAGVSHRAHRFGMDPAAGYSGKG
ncbi:hypothetical protein D3C80_1431750 [compost metagenome]